MTLEEGDGEVRALGRPPGSLVGAHCMAFQRPPVKLEPNDEGVITDGVLEEHDDYIVVGGQRLNKPLLEKPVDGEDHNIRIYYPRSMGGGSKRLFRKIGNVSRYERRLYERGRRRPVARAVAARPSPTRPSVAQYLPPGRASRAAGRLVHLRGVPAHAGHRH